MTIVASVRKAIPTRAELLAATAALARIALCGPELNARLDSVYLSMTRSSSKQSAGSTDRHCHRPAPRSKSP